MLKDMVLTCLQHPAHVNIAAPMLCCVHAQVESSAVQVKFFERRKGRVFHHPASVNFDCGRFESGWLVYTDMVETSKVRCR